MVTREDIENGYQLSYSELADFTHAIQVELFGWCACEDSDGDYPYSDCPREEEK